MPEQKKNFGCLGCVGVLSLIGFLMVVVLVGAFRADRDRLAAMTPEERAEYEAEREAEKQMRAQRREEAREAEEREEAARKAKGLGESAASYAGHRAAERIVRDALRAPSTGKFPRDTVSARRMSDIEEDGKAFHRWRVTGSVDAQNAFGAMIRSDWLVILVNDTEDGDVFPVAAALDNQLVWGDAKYATASGMTSAEEAMAEMQQRAEAQRHEREAERQRREAIEKAKWRTWTTADDRFSVEAQFSGVIAGEVRLTRRDGSTSQVDLDVLCDEDRKWIEDRGWERDAEEIQKTIDPTPQ